MIVALQYILTLFFGYKIFTTKGWERLVWYLAAVTLVSTAFNFFSEIALTKGHKIFVLFFLFSLFKEGRLKMKYIKQCPLFIPLLIVFVSYILIGLFDTRLNPLMGIYRGVYNYMVTYGAFFLGWLSVYDKINYGKLSKYLMNIGFVFTLYGLFCFRNGSVFWIQDPMHDLPMYRLMIMPANALYEMALRTVKPEMLMELQKQSSDKLYTPAEACNIIRKTLDKAAVHEGDDAVQKAQKPIKINMELISAQALAVVILFQISAYLVEVVLSLLLVLIFFSLAQKFRFSGTPKKLSYSTILTATIYATFPAIIAATFFQMVQFSYLSFQTVFFIIFFIYQIFAFNRIFETIFPRHPSDNSNPDDDF